MMRLPADWNFEVMEEGTILLHEDALDWELQNFGDAGVRVGYAAHPNW